MRNKLPIVLIVLGLTMTAFSAWDFGRVSALTPHVIDGAVGPSTAPGLGNPSNPASATFYMTNKPAIPIEVQLDITDADGSQTAYYGWDVGSPWTPDPQTGDEVVVVIETIDGVNGWVGVDYTTSSDGIVDKSIGVTSLTATDIEPFPTLTLLKYPTYVNVTWTNLIDANANVVNYSVYRGDNPAGPFSLVGESQPHVSSQANWYEETVSMGQWCYQISVNYRRDLTGDVYKTIGRSERQCTTIGAEPFIQTTNPANGDTGVPLAADIVITFSEAMNTGTVVWSFSDATINTSFTPSWTANTILTLSHSTPFTECINYTVNILSGRDADDNFALIGGPVPNPWWFIALCNNPVITRTTPADGATEVALDATIEVEFNMAMDTPTVTWTFSGPALSDPPAWNSPTNTIATFTHITDFMECTVYTMQIIAGDSTTGQPLVAGPVPNPWSFTTICPPNATLTAPAGGEVWTGTTSHDVTWTMSDNDPVTTLFVNLSYTSSAGSGAIAGPLTGLSSPATYSWTLPCINTTDAAVTVEVKDMDGNTMTDTSLPFEIDCAPPTVTNVQPADGANNVATNANIVITFSEDMAKTATQGAITIDPAVSGVAYAWSVSDTVLTITHAGFTPGMYNVTVGTGALDNTSTGNALAANYTWSFTVPFVLPNPNPPTVAATDLKKDSITITWTAPTTFTDGSALSAADIAGYYIERATSLTGARTNLTASGSLDATTYTDSGLSSETTYYYWVKTVLNDGRLSAWSTPAVGITLAPPAEDLLWLWILLIIIIIVVILLIIWLYLRKKKAPAEVPPEEVVEAPPEEMAEVPPEEVVTEAPPEEAPPEPTTEEVPPEPTEPKPGEPA